ncbi:hypothetical protein TDB9533_03553 [Thalassocella blandensis]|nr:hypothetical protein TDB9533_03553 [Thalassocella blandensis]
MKPTPGYFLGLCASALLAPAMVNAAEESQDFSAEAEFGLIMTSGNTETSSYKGRADITKDLKNWKNQFILEALYKEDEFTDEDTGEDYRQTTAEKYFASLRGDYKLNKEHRALFLYGEYDDNRFSGFEYQYSVSAGYTDRLFTRDNSHFAYSIGPGYSVDQPEDIEEDGEIIESDKESAFIVFASIEYVYKFSEKSKFKQTVHTNFAPDSDKNTKTKSVTSVTANINSSFAMKASYTVDYNSQVTPDSEHADTQTAITLVYTF